MKKIISAFICLVMTINIISTFPESIKAAEIIETDIEYTISVSPNTCQYDFVVPNDGYFYVQAATTESKSAGIVYGHTYISVYQDYKKYASINAACNDGWTYTDCYSFKKGSIVNLYLRTEGGDISTVKLKVVTVSPKNSEIENNNTKKKANKIKTKKQYNGVVQEDDVDYFVFKAPQKGTYSFNIVETTIRGSYVYCSLYKGKKQINYVLTKGGDGWRTVGKVKLKKGEKIYVYISNYYTNFYGNGIYGLKVKKCK